MINTVAEQDKNLYPVYPMLVRCLEIVEKWSGIPFCVILLAISLSGIDVSRRIYWPIVRDILGVIFFGRPFPPLCFIVPFFFNFLIL